MLATLGRTVFCLSICIFFQSICFVKWDATENLQWEHVQAQVEGIGYVQPHLAAKELGQARLPFMLAKAEYCLWWTKFNDLKWQDEATHTNTAGAHRIEHSVVSLVIIIILHDSVGCLCVTVQLFSLFFVRMGSSLWARDFVVFYILAPGTCRLPSIGSVFSLVLCVMRFFLKNDLQILNGYLCSKLPTSSRAPPGWCSCLV